MKSGRTEVDTAGEDVPRRSVHASDTRADYLRPPRESPGAAVSYAAPAISGLRTGGGAGEPPWVRGAASGSLVTDDLDHVEQSGPIRREPGGGRPPSKHKRKNMVASTPLQLACGRCAAAAGGAGRHNAS
ncbi:hypothetical protein HPB47_002083 [Ixodes persulcatus]|uniref:Uncharacterized protein n=1 Tax=Ixodes persulcatus TaxID=34615 RepID=A0AC60PM75_IXOPE|nr:hypothetical protein HPB47_002083 [Ixodes persulcatus]